MRFRKSSMPPILGEKPSLPLPQLGPNQPAPTAADRAAIVGYAIAHFREPKSTPGEHAWTRSFRHSSSRATTSSSRPSTARSCRPSHAASSSPTTIKTEMSEYDSQLRLRAAGVPATAAHHGRPGHAASRFASRTTTTREVVVERSAAMLFQRATRPERRDLGGEARAACWRPSASRRASSTCCFHDYRRGRLRHPGHLLDDRRREDAATSASSKRWAPPTAA